MPIHIVDKPLGLTSHDVVARARRALGTRAVGHAGTLDPLATGVLVVLSEEMTKLSPYLAESDKSYLAWVTFGASTLTLDAEGPVLEERDASGVTRAAVEEAVRPFLEVTEQLPPAFSAIKRGGVKGYEAARRGETLDLPPRPAGYGEVEVLAFGTPASLPARFAPQEDGLWHADDDGRVFERPPALTDGPTAIVSLRVAAGTYVRAFARDLGEALGSGAYLSGLVRTRAGRAALERAVTLERLADALPVEPGEVLPFGSVTLDASDAARVRLGQRLPPSFEGVALLVDEDGGPVALAENAGGRMSLLRVFPAK